MANNPVPGDEPAQPDEQDRRKRRPRRATVPGTGPAEADGPEPRLDDVAPPTKGTKKRPLSERDRWMLDEKPPHY